MAKDLKPLNQKSFAEFFVDRYPELDATKAPAAAPSAVPEVKEAAPRPKEDSSEKGRASAARGVSSERVEELARALDRSQGLTQPTKGFLTTELVVIGLPCEKPKGHLHKVVNGNRTFQVSGDPDYGVPFGRDIFIPMFLDTAFLMLGCPENNILCFRSASDVLRFLHLRTDQDWHAWRPTKPQVDDFLGSIDRIMGATFFSKAEVFVDPGDPKAKGKVKYHDRYQLMSRYKLWLTAGVHPNQHTLWPNAIQLDPLHAENVRNGGVVPIDFDLVRSCRSSVPRTKLGIWQRWRSHALSLANKPVAYIPLFGEGGLTQQFGIPMMGGKSGKNRTIEQIKDWQKRIVEAWPDCPNTIKGDVLILRPQVGPKMTFDSRLMRCISRWEREETPFLEETVSAARVRQVRQLPEAE